MAINCNYYQIRKMFRAISLKYKLNHHQLIVKQSTVAATKSSKSDRPSNADRIVIPKKVNRSPTDLLYTLSRTIGRDPTAKEYKFQDDPFLSPRSYTERIMYALSQESGKRTAQWIRQEHAELFNVR